VVTTNYENTCFNLQWRIYKYTYHWRPEAATDFMEAYSQKVSLSVRDFGGGGGGGRNRVTGLMCDDWTVR
jgi:hypothetical protein